MALGEGRFRCGSKGAAARSAALLLAGSCLAPHQRDPDSVAEPFAAMLRMAESPDLVVEVRPIALGMAERGLSPMTLSGVAAARVARKLVAQLPSDLISPPAFFFEVRECRITLRAGTDRRRLYFPRKDMFSLEVGEDGSDLWTVQRIRSRGVYRLLRALRRRSGGARSSQDIVPNSPGTGSSP